MIKKVILTLIIGLLAMPGWAQTFDKAKLDSFFHALEAGNKFMGSVAVSQHGKLIYTRSTGFADVETQLKSDAQTRYRIGSISKTFTAALVLKAVEENKLSLDQTIDHFFPGIMNADKITISHLLYHRSGIHNFTSNADYSEWNTRPKSIEEMTAIISKGGSDFEPGSQAKYSNSNYVLLSFILSKIYSKPYSSILNEKICKPAALKNTYFGGKVNLQHNESNSYKFTGNWQKETETDLSIAMGAGGIVSTPADLTKFAEALFAEKVIRRKSLEQMSTIKDNYGMGLIPIPFYDQAGLGHTGGIDGFSSVFCYFPASKLAYALTSNGSNYPNNNISIAVLSAVYHKPFDIPSFKSYELAAADLDQYLGVYSSKQLPLKITVSKNNITLMAQATGQSAFGLEATEKDVFKFDQAGIVLEFKPAENQMTLKQGGGVFTFSRE